MFILWLSGCWRPGIVYERFLVYFTCLKSHNALLNTRRKQCYEETGDVVDCPRQSRPCMDRTKKAVEAVQSRIDWNPCLKQKILAAELNLMSRTVSAYFAMIWSKSLQKINWSSSQCAFEEYYVWNIANSQTLVQERTFQKNFIYLQNFQGGWKILSPEW